MCFKSLLLPKAPVPPLRNPVLTFINCPPQIVLNQPNLLLSAETLSDRVIHPWFPGMTWFTSISSTTPHGVLVLGLETGRILGPPQPSPSLGPSQIQGHSIDLQCASLLADLTSSRHLLLAPEPRPIDLGTTPL